MGEVLCSGRVAADTTAEWEPIWIKLPPQEHVYTVSKPMTMPELVSRDGRDWIKYEARVLHRFTVTRQVHVERGE